MESTKNNQQDTCPRPGQIIHHKSIGKGVVREIEYTYEPPLGINDEVITVDFDVVGRKELSWHYAKAMIAIEGKQNE